MVDIQKILTDHHLWLRGQGGARADLRRADLHRANLECVKLCRADLECANLRRANLDGADLRRANLEGADLECANLRRANLRRANLYGAILDEACLDEIDIFGVIGNMKEIKSFMIEDYPIAYTNKLLQIGHMRFPIESWWKLSNPEIRVMDPDTALAFWKKWKATIRRIVELSPAVET